MFIITGAKNYVVQPIGENRFMFTSVSSLLLPLCYAA
jgi:hypothetical protein